MNILNLLLILFTIEGAISKSAVVEPKIADNNICSIRLKENVDTKYNAYLYKGISLYSVLDSIKFNSHIANLYMIIAGENDTVYASLPEILYAWNLSEVIYSLNRTLIVPMAFRDKIQPKQEKCNKIIFQQDLYPFRIINNPQKIIIKEGLPREKSDDKKNMYSHNIIIKCKNADWELNDKIINDLKRVDIERIIYGYHKGFHAKCIYSGVLIKDIINKLGIKVKQPQKAVIFVKAQDGYTIVFSWYELMNSKKSSQYIIADKIDGKPLPKGKGKYEIVAGGDFFADRSIKSVKEIIIKE